MRRRERHGRELRGPFSTKNPITETVILPRRRKRAVEFFAESLRDSVDQINTSCSRALVGVDIGFEEVPGTTRGWRSERVPLAAGIPADGEQRARVVLFQRPLERRGESRPALRTLIHRTLVEQLSALTGIPVEELDPSLSEEDWD